MILHCVYLIACRNANSVCIKIGVSSSLRSRLRNLQTACPYYITDVLAMPMESRREARTTETVLKKLLVSHRLQGEWFAATNDFLNTLVTVLHSLREHRFGCDEIDKIHHAIGPRLHLILRRHDFRFMRVKARLRRSQALIWSRKVAPPRIREDHDWARS